MDTRALDIIRGYSGRPIRVMEVCGTHTHAIFKFGIRNILPDNIKLISGPGCPVCVTETGFIDEAIYLAMEKGVTITTFGDLVRVPGTEMNLAQARAKGASLKIVYTPLDAVQYAKDHPDEKVVFLSVGFETTVPAACLAVKKAKEWGVSNFSLLTANKTMDEAYRVLKDQRQGRQYAQPRPLDQRPLHQGNLCSCNGLWLSFPWIILWNNMNILKGDSQEPPFLFYDETMKTMMR